VEQKAATTFVEGDDSGVEVLAGLYQAALYSAFPVWLVLADGQPELDVVANAHDEVS